MRFDPDKFRTETLTYSGGSLSYRFYENIPYVKRPTAPELQVLNICIPLAYTEGGSINGYTAETAPIFFPNGIGGYMEARPCRPYVREDGSLSTEAAALLHGYVVISAGARGRTTNIGGGYVGKAPACIVDLKAAVRYIRSISEHICGDTERIISNGTSAGGAMSALLAASGDSGLYLPYLSELCAEPTSDRIFAASCYCPITNLENADAAYEWQYGHISDQHWDKWEEINGVWKPTPMHTFLSGEQMKLSAQLRSSFPSYLNSAAPEGLSLDENGCGSFRERIEALIVSSAEKAAAEGREIPADCGIDLSERTADLSAYSAYITRMKAPCAFDNPDMYTPENELFGTESVNKRHFTEFGAGFGGECAPAETVFLMNAMNFLGNNGCASHWRIRHGAADRDTSFAVPVLLAEKLKQAGKNVDLFLPWGVPHSGDYDLDELFRWIDDICGIGRENVI